MATMLSDNASIHNITILKQQLTQLINRPKVQIEQSQIRQMGQFFLIDINEKFDKENEIIKGIAFKWDDFINSWINIQGQYEVEINQMNEQIDQKSIEIDNLQQIVSHFQKKVEFYEQKYETLKNQLFISNQNTINTYNEFTRLKQTSLKIEKQLVNKIQQYKHTASTLTNQKQILIDQIRDQKNCVIDLKQILQQLEIKIQSQQKELKLNSQKQQEILKYSQGLQQQLHEKVTDINVLANQVGLKRIQELLKLKLLSLDMKKIKFIHKEPQGTVQKMNNYKSFIFEFNKNQYKSSIFEFNSTLPIDPYFTHFILTSQSVKIRQDCEQLLNIDAKPFYTEIVQKRIPMHIWDQWIRNKLRQVLKQQKVTGESGQSEG